MEQDQIKQNRLRAVKAAFPLTIPVLTGYIFMGMAFGILLQSRGYGPLWAFAMGVFIYAGSGQFVAVGLLAAGFHPFTALLTTLMVNARHLFYGISMLERFKMFGREKLYMILSLTDETFALLNAAKPPEGVSPKAFYFSIAVLDHSYWITGCTLGAIVGSAMPINTTGIDFVMTALFVVIFLEQWQQRANRIPALIGFGVSVLCLILFGPDRFILVAMVTLIVIFSLLRTPLERRLGSS